jgi:hypothetical protein
MKIRKLKRNYIIANGGAKFGLQELADEIGLNLKKLKFQTNLWRYCLRIPF